MKPNTRPGIASLTNRAFTMIELVVVISLLLLLAGVLAPIVLQSKKEAEAAKILAVADGLSKACERFYVDNGRFPVDSTSVVATATHELVVGGASLPNWKGPYLLTPLTKADNPANAAIKVVNALGSITPPFSSASGSGAAAVFNGISEDVAKIVNDLTDGPETNWKVEGNVTYHGPVAGISAFGGALQGGGSNGEGGSPEISGGSGGGGAGGGSGGSGASVGGATITGTKSKVGVGSPAVLNFYLTGTL